MKYCENCKKHTLPFPAYGGYYKNGENVYVRDYLSLYCKKCCLPYAPSNKVSHTAVCKRCGDTGRAEPTLSEPDGIECPDCTRR